MRFGHFAIDDIAVRPSRLQLPGFIAAMASVGRTPAPTHELVERVVGLYEGLHIGNLEAGDILIETPAGPARLSKASFKMDNGVCDFGLDGLDARTPQGPLKAGHFALKSIDIPRFIRLAGSMSPAGQEPSTEQIFALFRFIQGADVNDLVAPSTVANKSVNIDSFATNWDQFIGSIPTQAHLSTRMDVPVSPKDPKLAPLIAAGIQSAKIDADIGLGWTEASGNLTLEPATLEIAGIAKAEARIVLANVPRALFEQPQKGAEVSAQIETGTVELTLHDLGLVDLVVSQYAASQNVSREVARSSLVEAIKSHSNQISDTNSDFATAVDAIGRFVETPQQTLVIKLTPIGKLSVQQIFQAVKSDPVDALARFKIETSTRL